MKIGKNNNLFMQTVNHHQENISKKIHRRIKERYTAFVPNLEIGFLETKGITGNIIDIKKQEVSDILEEIYNNPELLNKASQKSARSEIVCKIYLLEDKEQGWNLRLHTFPLGGVSSNKEEKPHYHRWTLASKILSGGYINTNYEVIPLDMANEQQKYYQYHLDKSENQIGQETRQAKNIGYYGLKKINDSLYKQGQTYHFPVDTPHSTMDCSEYTGTTLTVAHTAKPKRDYSSGFNQSSELTTVKEERFSDIQTFKNYLKKQIVFLKILDFSDALNNFLKEKDTLTQKEILHINDYNNYNYNETSLLPALGILEKTGFNSEEFSKETIHFIQNYCVKKNLYNDDIKELIVENQNDIYANKLTTVVKNIRLKQIIENHI
jgi:hypothetical protein